MPPSSPSFAPSFQIVVFAPDEQTGSVVFNAEHVPEPPLDTPPDFASLDDALARLHGETSSVGYAVADGAVRDDSEIIEVVKVRRTYPDPEVPPKPKAKSLRSRAGSAFRSIKNLARVSTRSSSHGRPYAQDVFASSQSTQATFATAPTPGTSPLTRRGSIIFTNLFRTPSRANAPSPYDFAPERYSDDVDDSDADDEEPVLSRAPSPSPSMSNFTTTIRRRLSILNFPPKTRTALSRPSSPPTLSRGSSVPSTSSSVPQTPTEETHPPPPPSKDATDDPDRTIGEMRLDSLHFEALSFDADQF